MENINELKELVFLCTLGVLLVLGVGLILLGNDLDRVEKKIDSLLSRGGEGRRKDGEADY